MLTGRSKVMPSAKERLHVIDNGRFVMQFFVLIGHLHYYFVLLNHECPNRHEYKYQHSITMLIRMVDIPVFAMISGFLSQGEQTPIRVQRTITGLLFPWFLASVLNVVVEFSMGQTPKSFGGFWYLPALVLWRMSTPIMHRMKTPVLFCVSIALSLLWPFVVKVSPIWFSRLFEFLPFFVAGLHLKPEHFAQLESTKLRVLACSLLAIICAGWLLCVESTQHLNYRAGYKMDLELPRTFTQSVHHRSGSPIEPIHKIVVLAGSFLMSFCVFAILPKGEYFFTPHGARSLYSYIFHPIVFNCLRIKHLFCVPQDLMSWALLWSLSFVFYLCVTSATFQRLAWIIVEPSWTQCVLKD